MPQVTVYVRNEDLSKWKSIPNKAEFIRDALNSGTGSNALRAVKNRIESVTMPPLEVIHAEVKDAIKTGENKSYDFCKHDQIKGFCKKGCK